MKLTTIGLVNLNTNQIVNLVNYLLKIQVIFYINGSNISDEETIPVTADYPTSSSETFSYRDNSNENNKSNEVNKREFYISSAPHTIEGTIFCPRLFEVKYNYTISRQMENQKMYQDEKEGAPFQEKGQAKLQENL